MAQLANKHVVPVVYALLPNKTEETYRQMFEQLAVEGRAWFISSYNNFLLYP